ncbi:proprotein convertase P-domain-containing protein [Leptolyngbya sp. CCNP1308]|uniref:proprotein convertase P-domain-containing protein n=1 Tax=Leptolyngbya sp. CCNP1308 TaxID=3110255 RepID=UPI002B20A0A2|nr:proprotein convertase P-domain-containing protein [Leptolyngbya sp. CCNP1308]MEA5449134.1 proprotein convertase P-domain-containing protein [Leptolyngbya sp. CCNP1308]
MGTFTNNKPVKINPGNPNTVLSPINISGLSDDVRKIKVTFDIQHTWTGDLRISLLNPAGLRVVLVNRRGGSSDDFKNVTFDQDAPTSIRDAIPPFTGTYRPEGDLKDFNGRSPNGTWQLEVRDLAFKDGGQLKSWTIDLELGSISSQYNIDIRILGGLTGSQQDAFALAAKRWSSIIIGDVPDANVQGEIVDDIRIDAKGAPIDGVGGILGQAGPTWIRAGSYFPATGVMTFDQDDLKKLEDDGLLLSVILHEMAHVIGFGTIWSYKGLLQGAGSLDPTFSGPQAMREFGTLLGAGTPTAVPVENGGGPGTRDSHWRETVFGSELMTGFINQGVNPVSRLTIASLADLGYQVNLEVADPYTLPSSIMLAMMGVGAESADHGGYGIILPTDIGILE